VVFRWLWIASLAANVGQWMRDVGAGWLMKDLSDSSRFMVALMQAATTLPLFLLSIPAGALADVLDRRRLILTCQMVSVVLAAGLALLAYFGQASPWSLLAATLGLGVCAALSNPAWQTVMTDLVPREQLPAAASLNSVSLNLSRAIGPTIGGVIVALAGPWATFALSALALVGVCVVLASRKPRLPNRTVRAERFLGAMKAGVRYVRFSAPMRAVLVRTLSFVPAAGAIWALMPVVAGDHLGLDSRGYGLMLGALGAGAVAAGFALPGLRLRLGPNRLLALGTLVYAAGVATIALAPIGWLGVAMMLPVGAGWITLVTSLNVAAQSGAPAWVRGRALACYLSAFFGCWALGSIAWGLVAQRFSLGETLLASVALLVLGLVTLARWRLRLVDADDLDRSDHWEDPRPAQDIAPDDGPVVITIRYRIRPEDAQAFQAAMAPVATTRYRDGAISWMLSRDTEEPERWLEVFIVESWEEHLRQHQRVTQADRRVQQAARAFHQGPGKPEVWHLIAADVRPAPEAPGDDDPREAGDSERG
jgi:MFS family permease/quinol monooxygenase YgiN